MLYFDWLWFIILIDYYARWLPLSARCNHIQDIWAKLISTQLEEAQQSINTMHNLQYFVYAIVH